LVALTISAGMLTAAILTRKERLFRDKMEYTVIFNDVEGNELAVRKVYEDSFAEPPDNLVLDVNQVFLDWGNPLYPVRSDTICSPSISNISDGINVFFVNTQYIKEKKSKKFQWRLGGQVALTELEAELLYNPKSLEFKKASSSLGRVYSTEKGIVGFTLNTGEALNAPCELADIEFKAIGNAFTFSEVAFNVNIAYTDSTHATYERLKSRVFIYK